MRDCINSYMKIGIVQFMASPEAQLLIKEPYEELGPHKLIWGSDLPSVERNCTYKQALSYLKDYCDFITPKDKDLILSGNMARILKLDTGRLRTPRPKLADVT